MRALGIDLNSSAMRIVELEKVPEGFRLTSAITIPTPLFAFDDPTAQNEKQRETQLNEARQLLDKFIEGGATVGRGITGVTGKEVILRYMRLDNAPEPQRKLMIDIELGDLASNTADQVIYDHVNLPGDSEEAAEIPALVVLAKNEYLERVRTNVSEMRCGITRITPSCLGLYQGFLLGSETKEGEVVLVASIGFGETELCLVRDGLLLFARNLNVGGRGLAEAIAEQRQMTPLKAWRALLAKGDLTPPASGSLDGGAMQIALWGAGDQLFRTLESSATFARLQMNKRTLQIGRVVIGGEIARIKGCKEFFQSRFKKPVELLNPFAQLESVKVPEICKKADNDPTKFPHAYTVAAGLAKIAFEDAPLAVNLEPLSVSARRKFVHQSLFLYAAALVAVLMVTLMLATAEEHASAARIERAKADRDKATFDRAQKSYETAVNEFKATEPVVRSLKAVYQPSFGFLKILRTLRTFADKHDELIVERVEFKPPADKEIKTPYTMVITLYFENKGRDYPKPLIQMLQELLLDKCRDAIRPNGFKQEEQDPGAESPLRNAGEKYLLTIALEGAS